MDLHYLDANETNGEKATWGLHKNTKCCFEQLLEAAPNKTSTHTSCLTQVRRKRYVDHCKRSKAELITDVLLWTPKYGCACVSQVATTYTFQFCADTGCSLQDLPRVMDNRDEWWEISGLSAQLDHENNEDSHHEMFHYICKYVTVTLEKELFRARIFLRAIHWKRFPIQFTLNYNFCVTNFLPENVI